MTKNLPWIILSAAAVASVAFAPIACGGSDSSTGTGGSGGSGAASSSSSSSHSSSGPASSSSSGGVDCTGFWNPGTCGDCAEGGCCQETADCAADTDCQACAAGQADPATCTTGTWATLRACLAAKCDMECLVHTTCNPVTSAECTGQGEACDLTFGLGGETGYVCFGPPNVQDCGTTCSNTNPGPFCKPTFHCDDPGTQKCMRYCCDDADCGPAGTTNKCDKSLLPAGSTVGLCVVGDADAGAAPACDAPDTTPAGACFMLMP